MSEFHGHVASVAEETLGSSTTADAVTSDTVLSIAETADFAEGLDVLIDGEVYEITDVDEGEETGVPTITVTPGLVADVDAETRVDIWDGDSTVSEWIATITDDTDGSAMSAPLTHTLIAMLGDGVRGIVGESVVARQDEADEWWVVEVIGSTPGYDPGFIRTGGLGADTVVWAGTEDGRRAQLDGIDGALEAFNDANEQTVNFDGVTNYVEGTLSTAADDEARVEIGQRAGEPGVNEVRIYTDDPDETAPGLVGAFAGGGTAYLDMEAPTLSTAASPSPQITLVSDPAGNTANINSPHAVNLTGDDEINLNSDGIILLAAGDHVEVTGNLNATLGDGSLGSGTISDEVDARIASGGGGGTSRPTFAFFMGA
jgi:hypothetical protein